VSKKLIKSLLITLLIFSLSTIVWAQRQTGSIKGTITDEEGNPLPGVTVTITSPQMIGSRTFVTTATGDFRFPAVPPGEYTLRAELSGFQTVERKGIIVHVGMTVTVNVQMKMATIEEEVTVTAPSPVVDVESSKLSVTMTSELLKNVPMARDLYDIVNAAPGAVSEGVTYRRTTSIHGGTVRSNTYAFDGVNMNDPVVMYPLTNINFDVMDEVEVETAGHPAEVGYTDGGYINIVTKSGGNKFSGGAVVYYTNDSFAQHLWTDEQINALGVSKPGVDKSWFDGSFTLGGPIMVDKVWFFSNVRYIRQEQSTNFIPFSLNFPGYPDYLNRSFGAYDWKHEEKMGFIKITAQLTPSLKFMGMFNYVDRYRPMYEQPAWYLPMQATRVWDHEKDYTGNFVVNYIIDQNTFLDFRVGYVHRWFPIPLQEEARGLPMIYNEGGPRYYLTTARFNETYLRKRFQIGAYLTRFQDDFLGGDHEIKLGAELEDAYGDWDWWRKDNMYLYWYQYDPYYWGYTSSGLGVMDVGFYICGPEEGSTKIIDRARRIGAYIQDSITFAERLTLNVGLRFDRSWGWKPAITKTAGGNPLSVYVGENYLKPIYGVNPFAEMTTEEWKDIMVWNEFSPRIGFTFDVFGNGKTALKGSFARYTEYMMLQYFSVLHPFYPRSFWFQTVDVNGNGWPDESDIYYHYGTTPRVMDPEYAKSKLDPDTSSPLSDEYLIGIQHELFKDFSLGINFIYKYKHNIAEDVLYDPETGKKWYTYEKAPEWWVPYTTVVPGIDIYDDTEVTIYLPRVGHPDFFYQFANASELWRKYWALEFIFNKRMSNGWQFAGSIVYSKAWGTIGGWYDQSWGWSGAGDSPNYFVNREGRINIDRPLQIKLMGTVQLPYRVFLSAYYRHYSGAPWAVDVNVRVDRSWMTANGLDPTYYSWGVLLEPLGTRRGRSSDILDLRVEKEFAIGDFGRLGVYIDAFNVLGWSSVSVGQDPISRWYPDPDDPMNPSAGRYTTSSTYQTVTSVSGIRTIKFSVRFSF